MDQQSDDEWEEQTVAVELVGMIDPDKLNMIDEQNTAVLGISSDELTILKLGGYAFAGKCEDAVGSVVILEDVSENDQEPKLKYLGHTTKIIKANRVFLKSKTELNQEKPTSDENALRPELFTNTSATVNEETPAIEMNTTQEKPTNNESTMQVEVSNTVTSVSEETSAKKMNTSEEIPSTQELNVGATDVQEMNVEE